jgi:hypothetical protein
MSADMRKDYGPAGEKYLVRPESWYAIRGKRSHLFWCGYLTDVDPMVNAAPDLTYVDPPWGTVISAFTDNTWLDVYKHTKALAGNGPCFCESSVSTADTVAAAIAGDFTSRRWDITFHQQHPAVLHYSGPKLPDDFDPTDYDDVEIPDLIMRTLEGGGTVLDPYAGRGLTACAAERNGWASINMELNPKRVSVALARLSSMTGSEPYEVT